MPFVDGIGYIDPHTAQQWREQEEQKYQTFEESKAAIEAKFGGTVTDIRYAGDESYIVSFSDGSKQTLYCETYAPLIGNGEWMTEAEFEESIG